ncbi:hypothetical protein DL89DRAFT_266717 [Linderina pennispora]|uniref:Transferase-domain-containing protein n=1 Tax=Linderina pennispora TaxID=61395 RepID=A0A1Y1WBH4_9FUNG|nr:uncharacterized protein DL89DRAFT_266717 [Linderina pennispora]ORX70504.1 hypothetical protein DL89DRAFT_266717 [Linderina pennispora]
MSQFMNLITSQVIPLTYVDASISVVNSDIILFYENTARNADFLNTSVLREAFYKALEKFPVYLGYLRQRADRGLAIVIDKDDLNMPNYLESTSDILFSDIKSSSYNPRTWPAGLMTTSMTPVPDQATGQIKMLHVHIVRFRESSGVAIFISSCHGVTDGTGFYSFVNRWADETRALMTGVSAPEIAVCFDRAVLVGDPTDARAEVDNLLRVSITDLPPAAIALTLLSPMERNKVIHSRRPNADHQGCLYRIGHDKLEYLRDGVQKCTLDGPRLSINDALSALIAKTVSQAQFANTTGLIDQPSKSGDMAHLHLTTIACDCRRHLGISDMGYIGNAQYMSMVTNPVERIIQATTFETLAEAAIKIRHAINRVQAPQIRAYIDMINQHSALYMGPITRAKMYGLRTTISNQSRFGLYDIDFGYGAADFITSRPARLASMVTILPTRPPSKDVYVSITDTPAVLESIHSNNFWRRFADLVY